MIQVLPEERRNKRGLALIQTVCAEAEKRSVFKLSMHARTTTGWSKYLQNLFADIRFLRQIENWYDFGEPCDYLEATTSLGTV
jgi:NDP-sugar pyrophosphorylase family protein